MEEEYKDRFGRTIKLGTKVIFAEYQRNSCLFTGIVTLITDKTMTVERDNYNGAWIRRISLSEVKNQLIVVV